MRKLILALVAALPCFAAADNVVLSAIMRNHKLSALEAAAVVVVADALGVKADFVISTGKRTGAPPSVYGPALILSNRCDRPFPEVWKERGKGWGQVAHSIGMHPGTFNKLRKQGHSVDQIIWMDAMQRRYGISHGRYSDWKSQGLSHGKILEMVARHDGNLDAIDPRHGNGQGKGHGGPPPARENGKGKGKGKGH